MTADQLSNLAEQERAAARRFAHSLNVCTAAGCLALHSDRLKDELQKEVARQLRARFHAAAQAQKRQNDSVADGRAFVRAYVEFMHYVEQLCPRAASGHGAEDQVADDHGAAHK
jgi:hypothetical protein